jgi:hypothetical protein
MRWLNESSRACASFAGTAEHAFRPWICDGGVSGEASLDQRTMLICLEVAGELLCILVWLVTQNPAVAPHNELVYRPSLRIEKLG